MEPLSEFQRDRARSLRRKLVRPLVAVVIVVFSMAVWGGPLRLGSQPADVMLVYVGAQDCAPCRAWQNGEGAAFLASAEFSRITYREVKSPHLEDVLMDENWPEDIRDYRSSIRRSDGVPLWLVISDRRIVEQHFGATAWRQRVLPALRSYSR
jgi:hypothetical protein